MSTGRMNTVAKPQPQDPEELVILEALRLTPREREIILDVLRRDEVLRKRNQQRVMRLKAELQALRRRGALRPTQTTPHTSTAPHSDWGGGGFSGPTPTTTTGPTSTTAVLAPNTIAQVVLRSENSCARCRVELGRIINRGAICRTCRQRICKACREYSSRTTDWVCCVCHKHMEIQAATGEWIHEFKRRSSIRRDSRTNINLQPATDIIKRTIRRSWTISNPQPRWNYLRGSSESRPFNSLPRGQDADSSPSPFSLLAPPHQSTSRTSLPRSPVSTSPIPSPIPSPLLREPPSSPQPQLSPRLLSPRNHSQELRRSYTDGQSIYVSPLLRQRSPKREPSPELFIRPTIEVDDVLKKPLKSPSCSSGGRTPPRRSPLQKEFPREFSNRCGRILPDTLNISQSKIDKPPRRISPLAKAYSEEPKIAPESPQHRPELKSFSSQGSQDLPKPPSNLPPSKFFQEIAKKMATEAQSKTKPPVSPHLQNYKQRTNEFFECIDSVPKFAPRRLGGSTTSFEEVVKAVLERKAAHEEKSASFEKHVSFESSDPTSSRKNSMLYEKDDTKMKSESYLLKSSDVPSSRIHSNTSNENKIKSYSTDDKRYQPFNTLSNLKSDSDPNTTGAQEDLSVGDDEGDVEVLSGTLFRKVTVKRRRQEMKKTSAIDNGTSIPSGPSPSSTNSRYHHRRTHKRSTTHFYDQNQPRNSSEHFSDLLSTIELDSIATSTGGRILLPPPDGEDYKLVFISSASDSSSSSKEEETEEEEHEADDEDFPDSCSNFSSPKPTILVDECDWDYFDTSFINTTMSTQQSTRTSMLHHYWAWNSPFNSPRRYLTPSPPILGSPRKSSRRGEISDTGTDEDSVSRLGESSSESSNSVGFRRKKISEESNQNCCAINCQNCGGAVPQKQYIPIPVPVPIPVPIPTLWNPSDSIILYNPDSTMDSQLQLRLQNIQENSASSNGIWLWPYCNKNLVENPFATIQNIMNPSTSHTDYQTMISADKSQSTTSYQPETTITQNNIDEQNGNIDQSQQTPTSSEVKNEESNTETMEVIPQPNELSGYLNSENNNSASSENDSESSSSSEGSNHNNVQRRRRTVQRTYNVTPGVDGDNKRFSDDALPSSSVEMESSSASSDGEHSSSPSDDGIINDHSDNEIVSSSSTDDETDSDDTGTVADRKSSKRFSHVFVVNTTNNSSSSSDNLSSNNSETSSDNDTDTEKDCLNCVLNSIRALSESDNERNNDIKQVEDNSCVLKQFKLLSEDDYFSDNNKPTLSTSENQSDTASSTSYTENIPELTLSDNKENVNESAISSVNSQENMQALVVSNNQSDNTANVQQTMSDNTENTNQCAENMLQLKMSDNTENITAIMSNTEILQEFIVSDNHNDNTENMNQFEISSMNTEKIYDTKTPLLLSVGDNENILEIKEASSLPVSDNENNRETQITTTLSVNDNVSNNSKQTVKLSEILKEKHTNKNKSRVIAECDLTSTTISNCNNLTTINDLIDNNENDISRVIAECDLTVKNDNNLTTINNNNGDLNDDNEINIKCLTSIIPPVSGVVTSVDSSAADGGGSMNSTLQNTNTGVSGTDCAVSRTDTIQLSTVLQQQPAVNSAHSGGSLTSDEQLTNKCNVAATTKYTSLVMITQETSAANSDNTTTTSYPSSSQVSVITSETTRLISNDQQQSDEVIVHHTNWESDDKIDEFNDNSDNSVLLSSPEPNSLSGYFITLENNNNQTTRNQRRPVIIQRKSDNDDDDNVTVVTGADTLSAVICLEEGLADDDSWVEDISHDEEEFASTTPTTTTAEEDDDESSGCEDSTALATTAICTSMIDREEELRGYHRSAIDFTLHTIVEESCEDSEVESISKQKKLGNRPHSATDLEKYFFYGLAENVNGAGSETSSLYSESIDSLPPGGLPNIEDDIQNNDIPEDDFEVEQHDDLSDHLSASRLEKYFLSGFMGFTPERRDSDGSGGSVGSDSEGGRPSPEQRRKRLVRARGTGRSHSSSLDNLLTNPELSQELSTSSLSLPQQNETQLDSEGSSTETDTHDEGTQPSSFDKLEGQFDTVKRKKCKKSNHQKPSSDSLPQSGGDDLNEDDNDDSKTPQPELNDSHKQSRDSGFVGSCDDLMKDQRSLNETPQTTAVIEAQTQLNSSNENITTNLIVKDNIEDNKNVQKKVESFPPATSLTRKDSFNNWSSDEETNLMMSKMRQFFKTMVANTQQKPSTTVVCTAAVTSKPTTPILNKSPRLLKSRGQKPPQLIYFENELTRLMKTVPGIRDDQVREIVEYLSSEDTWSDSYDSSDYTSSDLEGAVAGNRKSALQQEISESCQQIINKFDTNSPPPPVPGDQEGDEGDGGIVDETAHSLNRETAFVYQKLIASFSKMAAGDQAQDPKQNNSPPLIAKVMHHIGSRLVALMHEVSSGESHASNSPKIVHRYHRKLQHKISSGSTTTTEDDDSTSDNPDAGAESYSLLPRSRSHDLLLSEARILGHHQSTENTTDDRDRETSSDYERFSWRGSFESALMATHDSRTKLTLLSGDNSSSASLAAKRRSAGDLLFNSHKACSREQLDRVRSCGSICEDKSWVTTPTKPSRRRRSSVPDATRGDEDSANHSNDDDDDHESSRSTLPRSLQTIGTASSNSLPRLPLGGSSGGGSGVQHFIQNNNNVKSARYRPPGFNTFRSTNNSTNSSVSSVSNSVPTSNGPKRAVSAPGLQLAGVTQTRRDSRGRRIISTSGDDISLSELNTSPLLIRPRSGSSKSATPSPAPSNRSRGHSSVSSAEWPPSTEDDIDRLVAIHQSKSGLSTLGGRSDSLASVYSGAGDGRYGHVTVRGQVEFGLQYNYKAGALEIHVKQCRDLAPVDTKRNRSDPYVKVYLLPDKSKSGKRKTKVKKHTLNPIFDETLKFHMTLNSLETRTLWLTVWHSDMFGRNDFLGEVMMALENKVFDDPTPQWYTLQERTEPYDDLMSYKGDIIVGLKFVPPAPDMAVSKKGKRSKGALHILIKEAKNLTAVKANGTSDPFCKTYLLPDKGRSSKQKTSIQRRTCNPTWNCTFIYDDVSLQELAERSLELTIWDHDRLASNEFLGGVRFSLGTGKNNGKSVDWMDATGKELTLWQDMLNRPNFWVEGCVPLRASLENRIS